MPADPVSELRVAVRDAIARLGAEPAAEPTLERPPTADLGDYSTNAAMLLASSLGESPRDIAERLGAEVAAALGSEVDRVDVAGPGFLNLFLDDGWHRRAVAGILAADRFGAAEPRDPGVLL